MNGKEIGINTFLSSIRTNAAASQTLEAQRSIPIVVVCLWTIIRIMSLVFRVFTRERTERRSSFYAIFRIMLGEEKGKQQYASIPLPENGQNGTHRPYKIC